MAKVVFLHGLNTYGDDDLHIGPLKFGGMHERLANALVKYGVAVEALATLGAGSPEEQAERALNHLKKDNQKIILLGQSTGGLVARVLAAQLGVQRVQSVITWGTPHAGATAAKLGLELSEKLPQVQKIFARFGYDTKAKSRSFEFFTPEAMQAFNSKFPEVPGVDEVSLICEVSWRDLSWPLLPFYRKIHPDREPSDGFIWSSSQKRGKELGPFKLDHFGELGFFPHVDPRARARAQNEFERLAAQIAQLVSN